jgi:hypothetical protein
MKTMHGRLRWVIVPAFALAVMAGAGIPGLAVESALPARLSDAEFWKTIQDLSEPDGFFPSENLVSNEDTLQVVIPELRRAVKPGGVYIGVGPEQNFTYISALRPGLVFIPDIRRGNLDMHLMYKALMELSTDRAEFLSRLFSRERPKGLAATATVVDLFSAFTEATPSRERYDTNLAAIYAQLAKHGFKLEDADTRGIESIYSRFFASGPFLSYSSSPSGGRRYPSFAALQMITDAAGVAHGYLASEDNYKVVRGLEQNNLIVPLVANFAGPKTLRAIGNWVRERGGKVTTFYASNVEQYLFQDGSWGLFAENLAALPVDETSTFIRSCFNSCVNSNINSRVVMLLDSVPALVRDHRAGLIRGYYDLLARQR